METNYSRIGLDLDGVVARHSLRGFWIRLRLLKEKFLKKMKKLLKEKLLGKKIGKYS